jgi:transmembrane sensor
MADFNLNKEALNERDFRVLSTRDKILKYSAGFIPPEGKSEAVRLEELKFLMKNSVPPRTIRLKPLYYAAAAVLLAAILIYPVFILPGKQKIIVKFAETREIVLPDGTDVLINSGSKVSYSKRGFSKHRQIRLQGEAYLKVQKGNQFVINTPVGKVEILGTELNIYSRGNDFRVSCITGKVGVSAAKSYEIILPGESVEHTVNGLIKRSQDKIENVISWKHGEFNFEDEALVSIFDEIERQFNVSVKYDNLGSRYFTGNFSNKNLKEALDIVCIPMNLKYEVKEGNKVFVFNPK